MRDEHDGEPRFAAQPAQEPDALDLVAQVQVRGGLVEHEQPGLLGQRPRQHDPLPLAPAQPVQRRPRRASTPVASMAAGRARDPRALEEARRPVRERPMSTSSSTVCGKPGGTSCGTTATSPGHLRAPEAGRDPAPRADRRRRAGTRTRTAGGRAWSCRTRWGRSPPQISPGRTRRRSSDGEGRRGRPRPRDSAKARARSLDHGRHRRGTSAVRERRR